MTWWQLEARAVAEPEPELAEPTCGQTFAGRHANVLVLEPAKDVPDVRPVVRVPLEVSAAAPDQVPVGGAIDVVHGAPDRAQSARDERFPKALGSDRQVGHRREPAKALAEHAPAVDAKLLADPFCVADDRVRPEMGQVRSLGLRRLPRDVGPDRCRPTGPALVEQEHAIVLDSTLHPARQRACRPGGFHAWPTLEEDEVRAIDPVGRGHLPGEDGDRTARGVGVVERHCVFALGQDCSWDTVGDGHGSTIAARPPQCGVAMG